MSTLQDKAHELQRLHADPELLLLVNVWDAISAQVVADAPGTTALATASHSVAAAHGYPDGEQIPRDLMIETVGRIAAAVDLPVTADLEAGYGEAGETIARANDVGIVGANLEDGASTFVAPGRLDEPTVTRLVDALGPQKVNVIAVPGSLSLETLQ